MWRAVVVEYLTRDKSNASLNPAQVLFSHVKLFCNEYRASVAVGLAKPKCFFICQNFFICKNNFLTDY